MTYASEVLADSPYAYWKFDDAPSVTPQDSSGNGRHLYGLFGSYNQSVTGITTNLGNAISFSSDGRGSVTTLGDAFASSWTYECWYYPTNWTAGSPRGIFGWTPPAPNDGFWGLTHSDFGKSEGQFQLFRNNSVVATSVAGTVNNSINHIVATLDADTSTAKIYRNGTALTLDHSSGIDALAAVGERYLYLNFFEGSPNYTAGTMQHVAIYTSALSQSRIQAHYYAAGVPIPTRSPAPSRLKRPTNFGALQMGSRG